MKNMKEIGGSFMFFRKGGAKYGKSRNAVSIGYGIISLKFLTPSYQLFE